MMCPFSLLKKAGSTVVEYFEWDLPKVLSQGIAELLKYFDNRKFIRNPVFGNRNHNYYFTVMNYWSVTIKVIR
jgi:hypothetical protein